MKSTTNKRLDEIEKRLGPSEPVFIQVVYRCDIDGTEELGDVYEVKPNGSRRLPRKGDKTDD